MEKVFQANGPQKQVGAAILISDKIYLKPKVIRRDKDNLFQQRKKIHIYSLRHPLQCLEHNPQG